MKIPVSALPMIALLPLAAQAAVIAAPPTVASATPPVVTAASSDGRPAAIIHVAAVQPDGQDGEGSERPAADAMPGTVPDTVSDTVPEAPPVADAEAVLARLDKVTTRLTTFSADFEQTLYDEDSTPLQSSSGSLQIKRPGRFFWRYTEPDRQDIVADGETLWLYDHELEQVTVSPVDERLSGTPLALLTGTKPLTEEFQIKPLGASEGIDWLELTPRDAGSDFETVYLGLDASGIAAMELQDNFGQVTQIRFTDSQSNTPIDDAVFDFEPPAGVDVIGESPR